MTPQQAGRIGGQRTFTRYGADHMRRIGREGARVFWSRYKVHPLSTSQWGIFSRANGGLVAVIGTLPRPLILGEEGGEGE